MVAPKNHLNVYYVEQKLITGCPNSIPQGKFTYKIYFSEHGGNMENSTMDVEIEGNKIKVYQDETTNLTGDQLMVSGILIKHKSGKWIIANKPEDVNAEEVGGCTEFPVIDFDKKLLE